MGNRWFYDQALEEHVLMEQAPDGIWRELRRLPTRLSEMRTEGRSAQAERLAAYRIRKLNGES